MVDLQAIHVWFTSIIPSFSICSVFFFPFFSPWTPVFLRWFVTDCPWRHSHEKPGAKSQWRSVRCCVIRCIRSPWRRGVKNLGTTEGTSLQGYPWEIVPISGICGHLICQEGSEKLREHPWGERGEISVSLCSGRTSGHLLGVPTPSHCPGSLSARHGFPRKAWWSSTETITWTLHDVWLELWGEIGISTIKHGYTWGYTSRKSYNHPVFEGT